MYVKCEYVRLFIKCDSKHKKCYTSCIFRLFTLKIKKIYNSNFAIALSTKYKVNKTKFNEIFLTYRYVVCIRFERRN